MNRRRACFSRKRRNACGCLDRPAVPCMSKCRTDSSACLMSNMYERRVCSCAPPKSGEPWRRACSSARLETGVPKRLRILLPCIKSGAQKGLRILPPCIKSGEQKRLRILLPCIKSGAQKCLRILPPCIKSGVQKRLRILLPCIKSGAQKRLRTSKVVSRSVACASPHFRTDVQEAVDRLSFLSRHFETSLRLGAKTFPPSQSRRLEGAPRVQNESVQFSVFRETVFARFGCQNLKTRVSRSVHRMIWES